MKQSKEEAVKNGRKGGIKSGESRRAAAELRKKLANALQHKYTNKDTGEQIEGTEAIILALVSKAMNKKDKDQLNAIKYIMTVLGADKLESAVDYNLQAGRNRGNKKGRQLATQFLYNSVIYQEISGKRNKKSRKVLTKTI